MARNGSGTYSKINTFVAGNSITAAGHNQNWDDLVTEMTNSVAADGQTDITGQMRGSASGSVTAPAYSFTGDLNTGLYRAGADSIAIAAGGSNVFDNAAYTQTTPTPASSGGTITTKTLTCHTKRMGRTIHLWGDLAITTVGTATGTITFTLPVTAASVSAGSAFDRTSGTAILGFWLSNATTAVFTLTTIEAHVYTFSIVYEAST